MPDVVDEPGDEDDRDAGQDPAELTTPVDDPGCQRDPDAGDEPREDPDTAEQRRRLLVPALLRGDGDETRACRGAEEEPEGRETSRKCSGCDDPVHDRNRVIEPP